MSISILASPEEHTPAYNEQYFTLDSTNNAQTNFKYVADIKIDGTSIGIVKQAPDIDTGYAYINAQRLVENYVLNTVDPLIDRVNACADSIKYVTLEFSEEYGSPVSGFASSASGNCYVWNAAYDADDFVAYSFSQTTFSKPLNLYPLDSSGRIYTKATPLQSLFFYWHRAFGTNAVDQLHIWAYDEWDNLIMESKVANPYATIGANYERNLIYANVSRLGMIDLKVAYPGDVTYQSTSGDIIPSNTAYYLFRLETSGNVASSITYKVEIDSFCTIYDKYIVHFLNRLGAYDSFVFDLVSRDTLTRRQELYKKSPYTLDANDKYRYRAYDSNTSVYNTVSKNKIQLNSNWITEEQAAHLKDLILSPSILIEDGTQTFKAVTCTINDYETKKDVNDVLFNFVIDLEYSFEDIRQRG